MTRSDQRIAAAESQSSSAGRDRYLLRCLWQVTRPHWRQLLIATALLPLASGVGLLPPYLMKLAIDGAIVPRALLVNAPGTAVRVSAVGTIHASSVAAALVGCPTIYALTAARSAISVSGAGV